MFTNATHRKRQKGCGVDVRKLLCSPGTCLHRLFFPADVDGRLSLQNGFLTDMGCQYITSRNLRKEKQTFNPLVVNILPLIYSEIIRLNIRETVLVWGLWSLCADRTHSSPTTEDIYSRLVKKIFVY